MRITINTKKNMNLFTISMKYIGMKYMKYIEIYMKYMKYIGRI